MSLCRNGVVAIVALAVAHTGNGVEASAKIAFCSQLRASDIGTRKISTRKSIGITPLRGGREKTWRMDVGEDFDQLDGIPGMPETIGVTLESNSTASFKDKSRGPWPTIFSKPVEGANSVLPTRGAFGLQFPSLPEYSVEPAALYESSNIVAPHDHATDVAEEIAQKIAEGTRNIPPSTVNSIGDDDPNFSAAARDTVTRHVEPKEKRVTTSRSKNAPDRLDPARIPNLWLAVAHSDSIKTGKVKKIEVDGVPIALWRSATGEVSAVSDVCIHRGASLARGWVRADRLICPYHGFEFETDGRLANMPGAGPPTGSPDATAERASTATKPCNGRKAPAYLTKEVGGWIYIFPDENRPGATEHLQGPLVIPEAVSPNFRAVSGSMEIGGGVGACVENMLDMLHISFVHSFGNMQDPTPFEVSYAQGFDDPGKDAMATSQVTFRYRSGSKSFSKVLGGSPEVVVKNEFHLPYRAVIRVFFGTDSLKTIEATAVPLGKDRTVLHWKVYRNFALTHPLDEGPINKAIDFAFTKMMELTLREDKDIIENIYPEYQRGFMNARYDKQMMNFRKAIKKFEAITAERANSQMESSLQMELLRRISSSQRGLGSSAGDRASILNLIERLERVQGASDASTSLESVHTARDADSPVGHDAQREKSRSLGTVSSPSPSQEVRGQSIGRQGKKKVVAQEREGVEGVGARTPVASAVLADPKQVEGEWHLEYMSNGQLEGWDFAGSTELEKTERVSALKEAGGEAKLFDWNEKGRPLWADTSESVQIIDTKAKTLSNRAVYKGWSGFTTTVQLDACIEPLKEKANRFAVDFRKAIVDVGGIKLTFPHLQRFSPTGWLETTYVNKNIRIARGNKGSIFVLTRKPMSVSSSQLFRE